MIQPRSSGLRRHPEACGWDVALLGTAHVRGTLAPLRVRRKGATHETNKTALEVCDTDSIIVGANKTSISLENEFWRALREIAKERQTTLQDLFTSINTGRRDANMSSAIRCLFLLTSKMSKRPRMTV